MIAKKENRRQTCFSSPPRRHFSRFKRIIFSYERKTTASRPTEYLCFNSLGLKLIVHKFIIHKFTPIYFYSSALRTSSYKFLPSSLIKIRIDRGII
jgi:hypothetical protein